MSALKLTPAFLASSSSDARKLLAIRSDTVSVLLLGRTRTWLKVLGSSRFGRDPMRIHEEGEKKPTEEPTTFFLFISSGGMPPSAQLHFDDLVTCGYRGNARP